MKHLLLVVFVILGSVCAEQKSYRGYKTYEVTPATSSEYDLLKEWELVIGIDYWDGLKTQGPSRVMVTPDLQEEFVRFLGENSIDHSVLIEDVEETLIRERAERANARPRIPRSSAAGDFDRFWNLQEIEDYIDYLAETYPSLFRTFDLHTTHEGRVIKGVVISRNEAANNPVMFIDCGIHAREWAAHMSVVYLMYQLVERSADNSQLLDNIDWVIIPVLNPDGYVFSINNDRFWRKNRRPQSANCVGVDNNRNFAFEWRAMPGQECSIVFPGHEPLSEAETQAMSSLLFTYSSRIAMHVAVHTFGNMILWPFGWQANSPVPNWAEHQSLGQSIAAATQAFSGRSWIVGLLTAVLGTASGNSADYGYMIGRAEMMFILELRGGPGGGNAGFDLPANQMHEVAQETFIIFRMMGEYIANKKRLS